MPRWYPIETIPADRPKPMTGMAELYVLSSDKRVRVENEDGHVFVIRGNEQVLSPRQIMINANPLVATATCDGMVAATVSATASNADEATAPAINHLTGSVSGNASGLITAAFGEARPGWLPDFEFYVKTAASVASIRLLVGLFSANPDALPGTLHGAWFRYDTTLDSATAFWRVVTAAGGTPTVQALSTALAPGSAIAADTWYRLRIQFMGAVGGNPTGVRFYMNGRPCWVATLTLPLANQQLGFGVRVVTLTAAGKNFKWSRVAGTMCVGSVE